MSAYAYAYPRLRAWNLTLAALHAGQAVAVALVSSLVRDIAVPLATFYARYALAPDGSGPGWITVVEDTGLSVRIGLGCAAFFAITSLFHLALGTRWRAEYESMVASGINHYRWIEYSITCSIMGCLIGLLCGIRDVYHLVGLFALSASMNLFGIVFERENEARGALEEEKKRDEGEPVLWFGFWAGFLPFAAAWTALVGYFVGAVRLSPRPVPSFIWSIVVSLLLGMLTFPAALALHALRVGPWRRNEAGETTFMILSLVAKTLLAWQIVGGTLREVAIA